jgi:hypothetical protein
MRLPAADEIIADSKLAVSTAEQQLHGVTSTPVNAAQRLWGFSISCLFLV